MNTADNSPHAESVPRETLAHTADALFGYLRDLLYNPADARLDAAALPEEFADLAKGMRFLGGLLDQTAALAKALAVGNLGGPLPSPDNVIAAPLKALHASLRHLSWQTQQVAKGDYRQRVDFMGDFSQAFNHMVAQLEARRQTNLAERSRLERYVGLILANCPDPILLFDRLGRLAYVSDSYLRRSPFESADAILGTTIADLFGPLVSTPFLHEIEGMFETALRHKRAVETDQEMNFGLCGARRHYQVRIAPMLDTGGEAEGVIIFLYDATEILRARREAEQARALAERASRAKSDFLARMSHEIRTPMNAILGMTALLGTSDDPARRAEYTAAIDRASQRLLGLVNTVLDMVHLDTAELELARAAFDLHALLGRVFGSAAAQAEARGLRAGLELSDGLPVWVFGDEARLAQVMGHLLSNAVKFTPEGGRVTLSAEPLSRREGRCALSLSVSDSGVGISPAQQAGLFIPFEQLDGGTARQFEGAGLGLAISNRIVERMGGTITVRSQPGQGATFTVLLELEPAPPPSADSADGPASEDGIFAGRRVLLAEDIEINREILAALLEHTGLLIDWAPDGLRALEAFEAAPGRYDAILMDIHMPGMDGYAATRRIRASGLPGADGIPIIAMTANTFPEDVARCLDCGMNGHLGKPIDAAAVIARLREHLG